MRNITVISEKDTELLKSIADKFRDELIKLNIFKEDYEIDLTITPRKYRKWSYENINSERLGSLKKEIVENRLNELKENNYMVNNHSGVAKLGGNILRFIYFSNVSITELDTQ